MYLCVMCHSCLYLKEVGGKKFQQITHTQTLYIHDLAVELTIVIWHLEPINDVLAVVARELPSAQYK